MQFLLSAGNRPLSSFVRRNPSSLLLVVPVLLGLAGCGGVAPSMQSQSPVPSVQPAPANGGTSDASSSSSSDSSSSSPANSGSNGSSQAAPSGVPANAKTVAGVQTLPDWTWCTAKLNGKPCASGLGNATSTMTQEQDDPSLSGKSAHFTLGGKTQYSNALWWKQFGKDTQATHFVYDLDFYMKDPSAPEALEFDINQSMNGLRWTWGTECSYRDTGHWDIWNSEAGKWETTSVPCPEVSANAWHHLTWTVERVNGQTHYISVALDGKVYNVDTYYNPQQHFNGAGVTVAFQLDGDYRQDPYSVWLDNVSLSSW